MTQDKAEFNPDDPHEGIDFDALAEKLVGDLEEDSENAEDSSTEEEVEEEVEEESEDAADDDGEETAASEDAEDDKEAAWLKQKEAQDKELREARRRIKELEESKKQEATPAERAEEKRLVAEFLRDPAAFLSKYGEESKAGVLGKRLLGAALGDDAPDDFKKQVKELALEARLEALERDIREDDSSRTKIHEEAARQVRAEMLKSDIDDLIEEPDSLEDRYPYLSVITKDNREEAQQALEFKAIEMVRSGQWPTAAKVAQALEKDLVRSVSRFEVLKRRAADDTTQEDAGEERKQPKSLSNAKGTKRRSKKDLRKVQADWDEDKWVEYAESVYDRLLKSSS